jgi:hypothetical protein
VVDIENGSAVPIARVRGEPFKSSESKEAVVPDCHGLPAFGEDNKIDVFVGIKIGQYETGDRPVDEKIGRPIRARKSDAQWRVALTLGDRFRVSAIDEYLDPTPRGRLPVQRVDRSGRRVC